MTEIRYTRNLFLRCVCAVYLIAFASFYVQIPGLYGNNGILPARTQLDSNEPDFAVKIQNKPTLLWFASYLQLNTEYMMDVLALFGIFLAFTGFISQKFCIAPVFAGLWSLYYSLYNVGQTFMWFQWDILLLETGFLCLLIAPFKHKRIKGKDNPLDNLTFWLVKWLFFRLMFSSGIVKLTSGCPSWWGLTALKVHFESMCIPTPLAWFSHHLPAWFLKLNTVIALVSEIALPVLFFVPLRPVRIIAFWIQVFLQIGIIATGNFNFFNYLTIVLALSLLDDNSFSKGSPNRSGRASKILSWVVTLLIYGGLIYATYVLFGLKMTPQGILDSKIMFTKAQFENAVARALPVLIAMGTLQLLYHTIRAGKSPFDFSGGSTFSTMMSFVSTTMYIVASVAIFSDSLVPFSTLHPSGNLTVSPKLKESHAKLSHLHITNSYGLFRRITGVGGRPEVIIEGSNSMEGPWNEYHFLYKPGALNQNLPWVAPHQPRLDWQMWFAALGTYHQNPWIMSLTYRLLTNQKEVLDLMDKSKNPFPNSPPKYIRASLYHYHYTTPTRKDTSAIWTREKVAEYFPVFSKDHPPLLEYLKGFKIIPQDKRKENVNPAFIMYLDKLRDLVKTIDPPLFLLSLLASGLTIIFIGSLFGSSSSSTPSTKKSTNAQYQQETHRKGKKHNKH